MRDEGWLEFPVADIKFNLDQSVPVEGAATRKGTQSYINRNSQINKDNFSDNG